jgi:thiol peroxidase
MLPKITFQGSPLTLVGRPLKVAGQAPYFKAVSPDLKPVTSDDFKGKIRLLTSFPSLDTPVCDLQVKEFNKRASQISSDVVIVGLSKDLPSYKHIMGFIVTKENLTRTHLNKIKRYAVIEKYLKEKQK